MYSFNGVVLSGYLGPMYLTEETTWRPDVNTSRSPITVPGLHGEIDDELPTYNTAQLRITVTAKQDTPEALEVAVNKLQALFGQPNLVVTRDYGGIQAKAKAKLVSISHSGFLHVGKRNTVSATLALPGVFFKEDPQVWETNFAGALTGVEITTLRGSSAPITDAIFRVAGPATNPMITDAASGLGFIWNGTVPNGQYLFISCSTLFARISSNPDHWESGGTSADEWLDYSEDIVQIWPSTEAAPEPVLRLNANGGSGAAKLAVRAGRAFL